MKPVKHLFASTNKLPNVPELKYKRRVLHSPLSPKTKEKDTAKLTHDKTIEPMVLRSPHTGESIIRYALPNPSSKTKELIAEDESIRKITKRLKMVAHNLEKTYGFYVENGQQPAVKAANEELTLSIGDDLNSSLVSTSQFAAELEETVKEEQTLLESLFKWFQQQVNQMEEINKDQNISEAELPGSNNALFSISQIIKQVKKLKELKNRLTQRSGTSLEAILPKSMDIENTPDEIQRYEIMQQKIQEFIKTHSAEANVDVRETEPLADYSLNNQFDAMLKIFEKQADVLEKTINEQDLLETKYKQMENDFQVLLEEKFSLENELQKLKNSEKTKPTTAQTKKTGKAEKKKDKGKRGSSEEKKFLDRDSKSKDFQEVQQVAYELAVQNKFLQEKLKQALQEAERAKNQLAYFLNEGRDLLKSEGKYKATQERKSIGKIQVGDSEKTPLKEDTTEALVTDLGGLKTSDTLQEQQQLSLAQNGNSVEKSSEKKKGSFAVSDISQFHKTQNGSAVLRDSFEISTDENQYQILSSKHHNKLLRTELLDKENAGLLPTGTLLQENKTVTAPLNLPPIKRKQLNTDTTKASMLQSKTEKTNYQEAEQIQAFHATQQKDTVSAENQLPEDISLVSRSQAPPKYLEVSRNEEFDSHVKKSDGKLMHENQDLLSKSQLPVEKQETLSRTGHTVLDDVPYENLTLNRRDSLSKSQVQLKKQRISIGGKAITEEEEVLHEIPLPMDKVALSKSQSQTEQLGTIKMDKPNVKNEAISGFTDTEEILPSTGDQILDLKKVVDTDIEKRSSVTERHTLMAEMKTEAKRLSEVDTEDFTDGIRRGEIMGEIKKQSKINSEADIEGFTKGIEKSALMEEIKTQSNNFGKIVEHWTEATGRIDANGQIRMQPLKLSAMDTESFRAVSERSAIKEATETTNIYPGSNVEQMTDGTRTTDAKKKVETQRVSLPGSNVEPMTDATGTTDAKKTLETQTVSPRETDMESLTDTIGRGTIKEIDIDSFTDAIGRSTVKEETEVQSEIHPESDVEVFVDAIRKNSIRKRDIQNFVDIVRRGSIKDIDVENFTSAIRGGLIKETDIALLIDTVGSGSMKEEIKAQSEIHPGSNVESLTDVIQGTGAKRQLRAETVTLPGSDMENLPLQGTDAKEQFRTQPVMLPDTNIESFPDAIRRGSIKETDLESFADATRRGSIKEEIQTQSKTHPESHMEYLIDTIGGTDAKKQLKTEPLSLTDSHIDATGRGLIKEKTKTQSTIHPGGNEEHFTSQVGTTDTKWQLSAQLPTLPGSNVEQMTDGTRTTDAKKKVETQTVSLSGSNGVQFIDVIGGTDARGQAKKQPLNFSGTKVEHLTDAIGRTDTKGQLKTKPTKIPGADTEHFMGPIGRGAIRRDSKTQSKSHLEANTEYLPGITETGATQEETRIQSKSHHDPDREDIVGVSGRVVALEEMKTQSKSHPGLNFSTSKNIVTQQQDAVNRHTILRKFPKKVIEFSPFNKEEQSNEQILFYVTDFTNTLPGRSQDESSIYKVTHLPSMNKEIPEFIGSGAKTRERKTPPKIYLGSNVEHLNDADARRDKKVKLKTQPLIVPEHYADVTKRGSKHAEMKAKTKPYLDSLTEKFTGATGGSSTIHGETKRESKSHHGSNVGYVTDTAASTEAKDHPMTHLLTHPDSAIKQFTGAFGRGITHGEAKKASKSHFEHYVDVTERAMIPEVVKERSKSHIDNLIEKLTEMIARGTPHGETKKKSKSDPDSVIEQFSGSTGRGFTHGETKKASKSHFGPGIENFPHAIGRGKIHAENKAQPKSHLVKTSSKTNHMPTQHQDLLVRNIPQRQFPTKVINFSLLGKEGKPINEILNQQDEVKNTLPLMTSTAKKGTDIEGFMGAVGRSVMPREMKAQSKSYLGKRYFKTKHMNTPHQDSLARDVTHQFPAKVINLSPFSKEEEYNEYFSHYVTENSKLLPRRSRNYSSIDKATHFHSLYKEPLGQPNNGILKQQNELTNNLHVLISTFKIPIYEKVKNSLL